MPVNDIIIIKNGKNSYLHNPLPTKHWETSFMSVEESNLLMKLEGKIVDLSLKREFIQIPKYLYSMTLSMW